MSVCRVRRIVTFLIIAPYKYSYLLAYLLTYLLTVNGVTSRHTSAEKWRTKVDVCLSKITEQHPSAYHGEVAKKRD